MCCCPEPSHQHIAETEVQNVIHITKTKHTISFQFNNSLFTQELELGGPEPEAEVGRGGIPGCLAGGIPGCLAGLRGGWGGGIPACLAGLQAHTHGGEVEGSGLGGGVSRPTPRGEVEGSPGPDLGGIPACTEADTPQQTATAAGGTHPTGMHSYFGIILIPIPVKLKLFMITPLFLKI